MFLLLPGTVQAVQALQVQACLAVLAPVTKPCACCADIMMRPTTAMQSAGQLHETDALMLLLMLLLLLTISQGLCILYSM